MGRNGGKNPQGCPAVGTDLLRLALGVLISQGGRISRLLLSLHSSFMERHRPCLVGRIMTRSCSLLNQLVMQDFQLRYKSSTPRIWFWPLSMPIYGTTTASLSSSESPSWSFGTFCYVAGTSYARGLSIQSYVRLSLTSAIHDSFAIPY
jgi:hypothetical protein